MNGSASNKAKSNRCADRFASHPTFFRLQRRFTCVFAWRARRFLTENPSTPSQVQNLRAVEPPRAGAEESAGLYDLIQGSGEQDCEVRPTLNPHDHFVFSNGRFWTRRFCDDETRMPRLSRPQFGPALRWRLDTPACKSHYRFIQLAA